MIIVSQDKTKAINFKRLNYIQVSKVDENKSIIEINHSDCNYLIIAEYKTEERAKEIMMQIVKWQNILKKNSVLAMADKGFTFPQKYYFEMPEE